MRPQPTPVDSNMVDLESLGLGYPVEVDLEADMAYIPVQEHRGVHRTVEVTDGVLADYDVRSRLVGVEVFLRDGKAWPTDEPVIRRLLDELT